MVDAIARESMFIELLRQWLVPLNVLGQSVADNHHSAGPGQVELELHKVRNDPISVKDP